MDTNEYIMSSQNLSPSVDNATNNVCPICKKDLPPNTNFTFHMMLHPSDKPYDCDICLKVFKTKDDLRKHTIEDHVTERSFCCGICGRVFLHSGNLKRHHDIKHSSNAKRYECIYCDTPFKDYDQYRAHEAAHDKVTKYQCNSCRVFFDMQKNLDKHMEENKCTEKILQCCKNTFESRMEYVNHMLLKHKKYKSASHKCSTCGKAFLYACLKTVHEKTCQKKLGKNTSTAKDSDGNVIEFQCELCNRKFSTKRGICRHMRSHNKPEEENAKNRIYTCSICQKTLNSYSALYAHRAKHSLVKRHVCEFCQKGFYHQSLLVTHHKIVHMNERPYKCSYCDRTYPYKGSMLAHERLHTGERPFACNYCEMKFTRYSAKQTHERRHTGEKPFACAFCGKAFLQQSTCKQHEQRHEKRIVCEYCAYEFPSRKDYNLHRKGGQCFQNYDVTL